jgi:hypothetical protein
MKFKAGDAVWIHHSVHRGLTAGTVLKAYPSTEKKPFDTYMVRRTDGQIKFYLERHLSRRR